MDNYIHNVSGVKSAEELTSLLCGIGPQLDVSLGDISDQPSRKFPEVFPNCHYSVYSTPDLAYSRDVPYRMSG